VELNNRSELVDQLLQSNGWEGLEPAKVDQKKKEEALDIASQIHNAFREGSGKFVLEYLVQTFLTKPIVRPGEDAFAQGIREGRADVVRQLLSQIEFSKQGKKR
jgi:hypothetical protein